MIVSVDLVKVAEAIKLAMALREDSYTAGGSYSITLQSSIEEACKLKNLTGLSKMIVEDKLLTCWNTASDFADSIFIVEDSC